MTIGAAGRPVRVVVMTLVLGLVLGACSVLMPAAQIGRWDLQTVDGVKAVFPATVTFSGANISIDTGCSTGAGTYTLDGTHLVLAGVAFTQVNCGTGALAVQDGAFRALTGDSVSASISGELMTLNAGGQPPVLVLKRGGGS